MFVCPCVYLSVRPSVRLCVCNKKCAFLRAPPCGFLVPPCVFLCTPPCIFSVSPHVTGTLGHQDTWTHGHVDNRTMGGVRVPTYRNPVGIFLVVSIKLNLYIANISFQLNLNKSLLWWWHQEIVLWLCCHIMSPWLCNLGTTGQRVRRKSWNSMLREAFEEVLLCI